MQADLLARVVSELDRAGIDHMVTGSFASSFHGEPRMTRHIDLVVAPDAERVQLFVGRFDPTDFYINDAVSAVNRRDMFNIIEVRTGWKVDLIVQKDRPFSREEFLRRRPAVVGGVSTYVSSVEDTIVAKLEWSRTSGSDQQSRDVVAMIRVHRSKLDSAYLEYWSNELGIVDGLRRAMASAAS